MRLTILGATGPTGQQVLDQALAAGHDVTVLVRTPDRLPQSARDRVTVLTGDATLTSDVRQALTGSDAVISALGSGSDLKSDIASRAARALIPAAELSGTKRVVVLSALGSGTTATHAGAVPRLFGKLLMGTVFADKAVADDLVRSSGLGWTLVRPAILTNGPHTGSYSAVEVPQRKVGDRISRADVADFMLRAASDDVWSHRDAVLLTH
ncbi:NAD(P)-binding oxidoreductase [Promicromonospora sp. NPDC023805]|uniref:NAD(P)-dependent oxidoreductase n=1 Tax=Promicromonospora sp. NPDC023805 TaxID=3154696 RepID=UPI0033C3D715